jgi:myo-inositol 2-dehydrogenase / D-chiro-inositol 1-dehydrogenase
MATTEGVQGMGAGAGGDAAPGAALRVAVVGAGRIGRIHAGLLAGSVAGARPAAVYDTRPEAAAALAQELGVPAAGHVDALLGDPAVDAVAICSSTHTHANLVVAAARAGKAIFCEKPVSLDLSELDRALGAVAEAGVPFQIGFNRRFDPAHSSVREAVATGAVGDLHLVRISSRDPTPPTLDYVRGSGGIFLDMTIHDFDMARYLTDSEVTEVYAHGAVRVDRSFEQAGDVDTALAVLTHENGCITAIDNSRCAVYGYDQRVEVFGSRGMAASGNPLRHTGVVHSADGTHMPALPDFFSDRYVPSYLREWVAFVTAVRGGEAPPVGPADARPPLVIGLAAARSLDERRPVRVADLEAA